jgi:DHA1 family bicyclomycin/chloramphenicol resistance-like MFS transporter
MKVFIMKHILLPPMWLIILIGGLPHLCESVYSPSLPDIARSLITSESMVEYTLSVYLFAFAIGCLFFGKISDLWGRKPCILLGLCLFILGTLMCYLSPSIEFLILSRFIQAFGGSIGSVLGQAICRDAFEGPALGRAYASIGSALSFFPAIGPILGSFIATAYGWRHIFLFLALSSLLLFISVFWKLPETHFKRSNVNMLGVANRLIKDKNVVTFGILVGGCNGIAFSYYAEAPFYLMEVLGFSTMHYGMSFILLAFSSMLGALYTRKLQSRIEQEMIITYGLKLMIFSTICFVLSVFLCPNHLWLIVFALTSQMMTMFAIPLVTGNALSLALRDYRECIGTASSLFGCFYYLIVSSLTFAQGSIHNGTLYPMPFFFLGISLIMWIVKKIKN